MFAKEAPRGYLNHVAMIQSKIQSQNAPNYNRRVQLPATLFNRSPLRQRFGPNLGMNAKVSPSKRIPTGLSPLRARKHESNMLNSGQQAQPMGMGNVGRLTSREKDNRSQRKGYCENHQGKIATYIVSANTQSGEYCEKCAILLASQGFKVIKMEDRPLNMLKSGGNPLMEIDNPMRRAQITHFIEDLKQTCLFIRDKKDEIENELAKSQQLHGQQEQAIINYYGMLINCLQNHKNKSLQALKATKASCENPLNTRLQVLDQANSQCQEMRSDIFSSIDAIKRAEEKSFRPVMEMYRDRSQKLRNDTDQIYAFQVEPQRLMMNDCSEVARILLESIEISFEDTAYVTNQPSLRQKKTSVYFSFDNQQRQQEQQAQDQVKNVEMTETAREDDPVVDLSEKAGCFDQHEN